MKFNELMNMQLNKSDQLVKLAQSLGYDTEPRQLICNNGASVSGLLNFFDDNPGAMEAVVSWILNSATDLLEMEDLEEEECDEEDNED